MQMWRKKHLHLGTGWSRVERNERQENGKFVRKMMSQPRQGVKFLSDLRRTGQHYHQTRPRLHMADPGM